MELRLYQHAVFALYQLSLLLAICLMPVALVAKRLGVSLPMHRVVLRLGEVHEHAGTN